MDADHHKLILKDFKIEISFAGRLRWYGKQGGLEIIYDDVKSAWDVTYRLKQVLRKQRLEGGAET